MMDNKLYCVGFNHVRGIGPARLRLLLDAFGDVKSAWDAAPANLADAGLPAGVVEAVVDTRRQLSLEAVGERIARLGIQVLTWEDEAYPRRLAEIDNPPPVLYLRGELLPEDAWAAAIVGTRRMTAYGRQVTEELAGRLAAAGATVVSGLARGVDGVAHRAALDAGGRTLAVLGSGVDRIYPPEHRRLADELIQNGALISEYPPGAAPEAANFPPRNRIVAGLSKAVVVVEAGERSGALITATFAAEQGHEVFATPGGIYAPQSRGTNRLIQQGARPLLDPQDLLDELGLDEVPAYRAARQALPGDAIQAQLYELLGKEPLHVDELRARAGLPIDQVSAALTMMELKGLVRPVGGMQYVALYEQPAEYNLHKDQDAGAA
ncbi:MAG TPA: DNA-processing protein DprA [Anaerolineales bacterium]|nr:DNA-processing protein DprA [Anaerolineales bacterium]